MKESVAQLLQVGPRILEFVNVNQSVKELLIRHVIRESLGMPKSYLIILLNIFEIVLFKIADKKLEAISQT